MGLFGGGDASLILQVAADVTDADRGLHKVGDDIDDVDKKAQNASKSGGGLGSVFGALGKGALIAGGGVLALGGFLAAAAKSAADEEVGIARLNGALQNNIPNWDGNTKAIDSYITKQQKLAFTDDEIRDSLGNLVTSTHDLSEAQNLQALAMDLARAKGIDLKDASKLVGKVDMDNIGTLKKLGIVIDDHATKEEALAAIRKATAGQAEAYAKTSAGAMERVQNALGDAMETIGGAVLSIVSGPLQAFADWITSDEVQAGIEAIAGFIGGALTNAFKFVGDAIAAVTPIVKPFIDAIIGFWSSITSGGDIMATFGKYFSDLGGAIGNAWNTIAPALGDMIGKILSWIGENGPSILAKLGEWAKAFGSWLWDDAIPWLLKAAGDLIGTVLKWIGDNGPGILAKLGEWAVAFGTWLWQDAIPWLLQKAADLIGALLKWIGDNGPGILAKLGEWATAFFDWVNTEVLPNLPTWLGNIASALWTWVSETAKSLMDKLVNEWIPAVWTWITGPGGVVEKLAEKAGEIATALWTWVTDTAKAIPAQIGTWVAAFWDWITGKDGVIANLGKTLKTVVDGIGTWVSDTARDLPKTVMAIGGAILQGIMDGLGGAAKAIGDFLWGIAKGIWEAIVGFFTGGANDEKNKKQLPPTEPPPGPPSDIFDPRHPGRGATGMGGGGGSLIPNSLLNPGATGGGTGGVTILVYVDGMRWSMDELQTRLGLTIRNTRAGTAG